MAENLRIDHVIFGTSDIEGAARRLEEQHGLASIAGGRHEGRGTGNRIVPLGSGYLELMGIVDEDEAAGHPFCQWFARQVATGDRFLMWCVGTDDIHAVTSRLDLEIEEWSRATPEGDILSWRLAGLQVANEQPEVPFFIQWTVPIEMHPSRAPAQHGSEVRGFARIDLSGDEERVQRWLGNAVLPIRYGPRPSGITGVAIATDGGEIALP